MNPEQWQLLQVVLGFLGGGVGAALIAGFVTLIRGRSGDKREDKKLRADITDQITDMASDWLTKAEDRLKAVEEENAKLRTKVETLEQAAEVELRQRQQMIDHVAAVHSWIEKGAKPPPPERPVWAPGTMIFGTLVDNGVPDRNLG
ncbi:MAG: hypothetical protein WC322_02900 [Candidatus Paceibacterota bacterium]